MGSGRSKIVVGGTAEERTKEAHRQAVVAGGSYVVTSWDEFCFESNFAEVLKVKPELVVVEGLPAILSVGHSSLIKQRISGDSITYRPLHSHEVFVAWAPAFIFTVKDDLPEIITTEPSLYRRFEIVEI